MEEELEVIFDQFPGLTPLDLLGRRWKGTLDLNLSDKKSLLLDIVCPNFPSASSLEIRPDLDHIRTSFDDHNPTTLSKFLSYLKLTLENNDLDTNGLDIVDQNRNVVILEKLQILGFDKISDMSPDLNEITLVVAKDKKYRLKLTLSDEYPKVGPHIFSPDIPEESWHPTWNPGMNLNDIGEEFEKAIDEMEPIWNILKELDEETWVLDPESPSGRDMSRRVVVQPSVSVIISVDPKNWDSVPNLKFLGPDSLVQPLRQKLAQNVERYSPEYGLKRNLENILGLFFPHPEEVEKDDFNTDCSICYCQRLGDELPEKTCHNVKCAKQFHSSCLYDWLQSLRNHQRSMITVYGNCPFCEEQISCEKPLNFDDEK